MNIGSTYTSWLENTTPAFPAEMALAIALEDRGVFEGGEIEGEAEGEVEQRGRQWGRKGREQT